MIANRADAETYFRYRGNRPTKNVANNTKLVRVTDELTALKFHQTMIAFYGRDAVKLTLSGWHTITTLERINSFTPARIFRSAGISYLSTPNGTTLYEEGVVIEPDGSVRDPMAPDRFAAIAKAANGRQTFLNYGQRAMRSLDRGEQHYCSECSYHPAPGCFMHHVDSDERVVPEAWRHELIRGARTERSETAVRKVGRQFGSWLWDLVRTDWIEGADPLGLFRVPAQT